MRILIQNATIVNEGKCFSGSVLIENETILQIFTETPPSDLQTNQTIDAEGLLLIPGVIDEHVHFREPGLTHKGDFYTESRAAIAGGITSFLDMPNVLPQTTSISSLQQKTELAAEKSLANFGFFFGATNDNFEELLKLHDHRTCGIKLFLGSSTGNMLVNHRQTLEKIFSEIPLPIAIHAESEPIIRANIETYKNRFGNNIPISCHPLIRSQEACFNATSQAIELATKYNAQLHVLHISTAKELTLFQAGKSPEEKRITAETCPQYLWFNDSDYQELGARIKCNPAIKTVTDREALQQGIANGTIDTVATDHAPHLLSEKEGDCLHALSGIPLIQHSLVAMLQLAQKGFFSIEQVVEKMCHNPALIFHIEKRGFIRNGYFADLVLINPNLLQKVSSWNILSKCGWSPFENKSFTHSVTHTFVNGNLVYTHGQFNETFKGKSLTFKH